MESFKPLEAKGLRTKGVNSWQEQRSRHQCSSAVSCYCTSLVSIDIIIERPHILERVGPLELPRLRALEVWAAAVPVSSFAASSASPRSGSSRAHPYPVGEAIEGSFFELLPSIATRATNNSGRDESMDITPIRRADSSLDIPYDPIQLMTWIEPSASRDARP